jgi:hypothetical protein
MIERLFDSRPQIRRIFYPDSPDAHGLGNLGRSQGFSDPSASRKSGYFHFLGRSRGLGIWFERNTERERLDLCDDH